MNFYRKYRPQTFADLVGQENISTSLLKQLESGKTAHAYLFSGPRGTGKTSTARIFAKALNCQRYWEQSAATSKQQDKDKKLLTADSSQPTVFGEPCNQCQNCQAITNGSYLDVLEIDAASNRGIDEIRDLREKIKLAPTSGRFKVYIIDEVHMLTSEAFNALLKTLEEPPTHAVFILATTEPQKLPATIVSRTQKFNFARPSVEQVVQKLQLIGKKEALGLDKKSFEEIAKASGAAFRDAEVLLDKVASVNPKATLEEVRAVVGGSDSGQVVELLELVLDKKTKNAISWLSSYEEKGGNLKVLSESLLFLLREVLMIKVGVRIETESNFAPEVFAKLETLRKQLLKERLTGLISLFSGAASDFRDSPIPSLPLELAVIEACEFNVDEEVEIEKKPEVKVEATKKEETEERAAEIAGLKPEIKEAADASEKEVKKEKETVLNSEAINKDIRNLQEKWPDVLKKVKPHNNSLEIFLRGARPLSLEDDLVNLEVAFRFHKERIEEPKNNGVLVTVISEVLGRPVRIKGIVGEKLAKATPKADQVEEVDPVEIFGKLN